MIKAGLVSITFRQLSPAEIVELVCQAGLETIEWGSDIHVPVGDIAQANTVRALTENAGLSTASYGSYYRVGDNNPFSFQDVLSTAAALQTDVIRVWAGTLGSAEATPDDRQLVIQDSQAIAEMAATRNIRIAYEFHGNTLTDTTESTLDLLKTVNHPNLYSYWQPPTGWTQDQLNQSLQQILPYLQHLHVFHWNSNYERLPLNDGRTKWQQLLQIIRDQKPNHQCSAMIEFVRDNSPEAFLEDARALKEILPSS